MFNGSSSEDEAKILIIEEEQNKIKQNQEIIGKVGSKSMCTEIFINNEKKRYKE